MLGPVPGTPGHCAMRYLAIHQHESSDVGADPIEQS